MGTALGRACHSVGNRVWHSAGYSAGNSAGKVNSVGHSVGKIFRCGRSGTPSGTALGTVSFRNRAGHG